MAIEFDYGSLLMESAVVSRMLVGEAVGMKRSGFLTHWTGKDICTDPAALTADLRTAYVARLLSLLRDGFWLMPSGEKLMAKLDGDPPRMLQYAAHVTCFTELRLSSARPHFKRYGLLGIVVSRQFVLDRFGGPVKYVRNGMNDGYVANLVQLLTWIQTQIDNKVEHAQTIMDNLGLLIGFAKPMSEVGDDFTLLDEQEWRIGHSHRQEDAKRIRATGQAKPKYLVPFSRDDVEMLVVPDTGVKEMARREPDVIKWTGAQPLSILTVQEVEQF